MDADGGAVRRVTTDPADETLPSWSRDGRRIYFVSSKAGQPDVWAVPAVGGEPTRVTTGGGHAAAESPDGRELYFWRRGPKVGIWVKPVAGGPEALVHPDVHPHVPVSWAVGKTGLYFIRELTGEGHARRGAVKSTICVYDFATKAVYDLVGLEKPGWGLTVSPDERWLLYAQYDRRDSDLFLIEQRP
jgi:Tol biopolymer transport system component